MTHRGPFQPLLFCDSVPLLPERMFFSLETHLQTPSESQVLAGFTSVPPHQPTNNKTRRYAALSDVLRVLSPVMPAGVGIILRTVCCKQESSKHRSKIARYKPVSYRYTEPQSPKSKHSSKSAPTLVPHKP